MNSVDFPLSPAPMRKTPIDMRLLSIVIDVAQSHINNTSDSIHNGEISDEDRKKLKKSVKAVQSLKKWAQAQSIHDANLHNKKMRLSPSSSKAASCEGWCLSRISDEEIEICRFYDTSPDKGSASTPIFSSDEDVWMLVLTGRGDHHKDAVRLVEHFNPVYFSQISDSVKATLKERTEVCFHGESDGYIAVNVFVKQHDGSEFFQRMSVSKSNPEEIIIDLAQYSKCHGADFESPGATPCPPEVIAALDLAVPRAMELIQSHLEILEMNFKSHRYA